MTSQYTSDYPSGVSFPDKFKKFFSEFYKVSDTPEKHDLYASQFTENATLVMASKTAKGRSGMCLPLILSNPLEPPLARPVAIFTTLSNFQFR